MPIAIIYSVVILGALLIVGARVAARMGHITSRASKFVMVGVIAVGGIVVMLYPFLFTEPVGG